MYTVLFIGALAFMIFIAGCDSPKSHDEDETDSTEMSLDENDMDVNPTTTNNSANASTPDATMQSYVDRYPNMEYSYIQTEDGNIATLKGNYQVKVDGIDNDDDMDEFIKFVEQNYANKELSRKEYNKNIEEEAEPKNGFDAYYTALKNNIEYPEDALDEEVGGTVFVEFIVDENGKVTNVTPMEAMYYTKNKKYMEEFDQAAVEAIKKTDWNWTPAKQGDKPVKMKLEIPITFAANS